MKKTITAGGIGIAVGLAALVPTSLRAQATATGFIDLTSLNLISGANPVVWSGAWTVTQATSANANNVVNTGTTMALSAPSSANSVAITPVIGLSGIFEMSLGQINSLPGGQFGQTSSSTLLQSTFSTTGLTPLTISAAVNSILTAQAGALSAVNYSQDSFSVTIDNNPLLAWSDNIAAAANQTLPTDSQAANLSDAFSLDAGTHSISIQLGTGQQINPVAPVPEPVTYILFGGALLLLPFRSSLLKLVRPAKQTSRI